jgi:hypothetical protein
MECSNNLCLTCYHANNTSTNGGNESTPSVDQTKTGTS